MIGVLLPPGTVALSNMQWTTIGILIQHARAGRRLSQEEVAVGARIKRPFYCQIELGQRRCSVEVLGRIARVLRLTPAEVARIVDLAAGATDA